MTELYLENILSVYLETSLKPADAFETAKGCGTARRGILRSHRERALKVAQEDGGRYSESTLAYVGH